MRFLKALFQLPSGDNDADMKLRMAFENFLQERKMIDVSHF
jgi:hypothetical protein